MSRTDNHTPCNQLEERIHRYSQRIKTQHNAKFQLVQQKDKLRNLSTSIGRKVTERFQKMSYMLDQRPRLKSQLSTNHNLPSIERRYHKKKPTPLTQKQKQIQKLQKRIQYGQRASEEYVNRKKTIQTKSRYDQYLQNFRISQQQGYRRLLQTLKKQQVRFISKPYIEQARHQIQKIKKSKSTLPQKFNQLNQIYHSFQKKDGYGMDEALELETQANLALAELYLGQKF